MTKQLPHDHGQAMEHELDHMPSAGEFQTAAEIFKMCIRDRLEIPRLYPSLMT